MRVLIVEDDPSLAQSLREGFERHGFDVEHTSGGREAILLAAQVDLVLLDLGLPDIDGKEVCRAVRTTSSVPIIVLTARSDEIDRVAAARDGSG